MNLKKRAFAILGMNIHDEIVAEAARVRFEVGELARDRSGNLVEVLYVYDDFLHYKVLATGRIFVDEHNRFLAKLSPLRQLAEVAE